MGYIILSFNKCAIDTGSGSLRHLLNLSTHFPESFIP
ncbi:hypothetical protein ES705_17114 [subsurface metagenome]